MEPTKQVFFSAVLIMLSSIMAVTITFIKDAKLTPFQNLIIVLLYLASFMSSLYLLLYTLHICIFLPGILIVIYGITGGIPKYYLLAKEIAIVELILFILYQILFKSKWGKKNFVPKLIKRLKCLKTK